MSVRRTAVGKIKRVNRYKNVCLLQRLQMMSLVIELLLIKVDTKYQSRAFYMGLLSYSYSVEKECQVPRSEIRNGAGKLQDPIKQTGFQGNHLTSFSI